MGVHHHFTKDGTKIETDIDMVDYVNQSVEIYNSHVGSQTWPMKDKVRYPSYEPTQTEIDTLGVTPGVFGSSAASLFMKALYCARMVRVDICYAIKSLSKYVTKWTALYDKTLRHLY